MFSQHKNLAISPDELFQYFHDTRWNQVKADMVAAAQYRKNNESLSRWICIYLESNRTTKLMQWPSYDLGRSLLFDLGQAYFVFGNKKNEQEDKTHEFSPKCKNFIEKLQQAVEIAKKDQNPRTLSHVNELITTGIVFLIGLQGVSQDSRKAFQYFIESAERNSPYGLCILGLMYEKGQGVEQNNQEAVSLYRRAAEQGSQRALCWLGLMYEKGQGVEQCNQQALSLYRRAADKSSPFGLCLLGRMYEKGKGVEKSYQEAISLYRIAADQSDLFGLYSLAFMYEKGRGVAQNYQEAVSLYSKGAEQSYLPALYRLGLMHERGQGVVQNDQEAVRLWVKAAIRRGYRDEIKECLNTIASRFKSAIFYSAIIKKDFKFFSLLVRRDENLAKEFFLTEKVFIQGDPLLVNFFLEWVQEDPEIISEHLVDQLVFLLYQKNDEFFMLQKIISDPTWLLQVDTSLWDEELLELYCLELYGQFCYHHREGRSLDDSLRDTIFDSAFLQKMEKINKAISSKERKSILKLIMLGIFVRLFFTRGFGVSARAATDFSWNEIDFLFLLYQQSTKSAGLFVDSSRKAIMNCLEELFEKGLIIKESLSQEDESSDTLMESRIQLVEEKRVLTSGLVDYCVWKKLEKKEIHWEDENKTEMNDYKPLTP